MYQTACPACGAEVEFKSSASVMAVCPYCRSTLLREADAVRNIGQMSEVVEDYTRIQIGTAGQYKGQHFGVVGRIQLRYEDGFWNEWRVLFDNGQEAWLSDGSGQYVFTEPKGLAANAPHFEQLQPGSAFGWNGLNFIATDIRTAQCVAGEGELPFKIGSGWQARVADFRCDEQFLTLDYSENDPPLLYAGVGTTLEDLKCQFLREAEQVEKGAGKLKGRASTLECPNCGSGIEHVPGQAEHLVCPSCHAEVGMNAGQAEVLKLHKQLATPRTTLQPGDKATIDQTRWTLIGLMCCREFGTDESSIWNEYLLFNANKGFLWLVESDQSWTRTTVLNTLPTPIGGSSVRHQNKTYTHKWRYGAEVIYAAGAFNWRVSIGDKTEVNDYNGPDGLLSCEKTAAEITWSMSTPVRAKQIARWFGKTGAEVLGQEEEAAAPAAAELRPLSVPALIATVILFITLLPRLFDAGFFGILIAIVAMALLWLPV